MLNQSKYIRAYVEYLHPKEVYSVKKQGLSLVDSLHWHSTVLPTPWGLFLVHFVFFCLFGASMYIGLHFDIKLYPPILLLTPFPDSRYSEVPHKIMS